MPRAKATRAKATRTKLKVKSTTGTTGEIRVTDCQTCPSYLDLDIEIPNEPATGNVTVSYEVVQSAAKTGLRVIKLKGLG